ncbi:MAG: extracellular solute-binding protein [Deltaproteobacteria bacterium]|nr:extracellular solute-binding protein [Deltaproteobacteria bacterium]
MRKTILGTLAITLLAACGKGDKPQPTTAPTTAAPTTAPPTTAAPTTAAPTTPTEADAGPTPTTAAAPDAAAPEPPVPTEPATEIVLWHSFRAGELEAFDKVVANYNASQKKVYVKSHAIPFDPFVDKITVTVPRGEGPDLFIFAHNMIGNWVDKGVLEPISGMVDGEYLKQFTPWSVKALVYQKSLYGLPLAFKSLVMFYNKKLIPEPAATMEELIEQVKPLQKPDERFGIVYQAGGLYFHAMWFHAFGGAVFDDNHQPAFDTPAQVAGLEFVRTLHMDHKVLPAGVGGFMVTSLFNEGNAAVVFNGPWFLAELTPSDKLDFGIKMIPTVQGKQPKPFLGIESLFVSKTSKHKEAAIQAALYLAGEESARERMTTGKQPVCHAKVLAEGAAADPMMKVFMDQADQAVLMDATPQMQLMWTPGDTAISAGIFVADRKPAAELKKAQAKALAEIKRAEQPQ